MPKTLLHYLLGAAVLAFASCEPRRFSHAEKPDLQAAPPTKATSSVAPTEQPKPPEPKATPAAPQAPTSISAPTQAVTTAPAGDAYEAIADVEKRSFAKRFDGLLEPVLKKGGPTDQAAEWLKEADSRARAVMQLSRYKLEFKDTNGEKQLIALVEAVRSFRPSGSTLRWGSQPETLKLARKMLEEDQQKGAPINRNARLALSKTSNMGNYSKFQPRTRMPDISSKLISLELTADDLLPFLFHLDDCRRDVERLREEDRKLYEFISNFDDKDCFLLIVAAGNISPFNFDDKFIFKDKTLDKLYLEEARTARYGPFSKEFEEVLEKRLKPLFTEQARGYQRSVAEWFHASDKQAIECLVTIDNFQNSYYRYIKATVPDFKYRLKAVVPRGDDGKPLLKPLEPHTFNFDYADFVTLETRVSKPPYSGSICHTTQVKPLR